MLSTDAVRSISIGETVDEYEKEVRNSSIRKGKSERDLAIFGLGLNGEAGEVAEKIKKYLRGDGPIDEDLLLKELHDCLWYLISLGHFYGKSLPDIMKIGLVKMADRKARGVTRGSGDTR
jgi:NTP pyrophosphatase (non-canonical NTP hydrolase)